MLSSFSPISQQTEENKKQIGKVVIYRVRNFIIIVFEYTRFTVIILAEQAILTS